MNARIEIQVEIIKTLLPASGSVGDLYLIRLKLMSKMMYMIIVPLPIPRDLVKNNYKCTDE